ncbi:MAG: TonB-dependent receptor [Gammaproteobacteria bacterium TMED1]|nr:MAG: TonB-dependent receptor [Gammaproteobacteria bacterium TMED1]
MTRTTKLFSAFLAVWLPQALADEHSSKGSFIEEIVVTAEKRAESEMTVPIAVTAFDEFKIEKLNIQNITDLSLMTPGLEVRADGANNLFTMRGVGTAFSSFHANESAVAMYQNGLATVASRTAGIDTAGFDIERIEVLRGPQNTMYGRNSIGGAINYVRKAPEAEFGAEVLTEMSSYGGHRLGVAVTGPISDLVNFRVTAFQAQRDGFMKNTSNAVSALCNIGACTTDDLDSIDTLTVVPQLEIKRENWKLNLAGTTYEHKRIMGRNDVGPWPEGSLPAGLNWPTHVPGENFLGAMYGWNRTAQLGEVQMNRDPIHWSEGDQWVITLDWDISDQVSLRYQAGRSDSRDQRYQDRDQTDRVGSSGDVSAAADNGGFYRDWLSIDEGHYIVDQRELTLDIAYSDKLQFRVGLFTMDANRTINNDQKQYENPAFYTSTLEQMRALHAAGGMPDLGATFPDVSSCSELLEQNYGYPYLTSAEGASAPFWSTEPKGPENPWGLGPGRLYCYGERGVEALSYGGTNSPFGFFGTLNNKQHQKSIFAEVSYQMNDQVNVSLGMRYIDDEKPTSAFDRINVPGGATFNPFNSALDGLDGYAQEAYYDNLGTPAPRFINSAIMEHEMLEFSSPVFNFDIEYAPADGMFVFARVATGYRSGGGNNRIGLVGGDYDPFYLFDEEDLLTYEVGVKTFVEDWNLRIMTSAFFYDYENFITDTALTLTPDDPWETAFEGSINYGLVEIYGFDFEFVWQVPQVENLTIFGFYAYNKGTVKDPFVLPEYTGEEGYAGYAFIGSLGGNSLPYNPEQKFNLSAEYNWPLDNGSALSLLGVWSWTGEFEANVANNPSELADSFERVDVRLTWASADDRYRVSLYGQNIFDDRQVQLYEEEFYELPDPVTGGDLEVVVPSPFISSYELWGLEARVSF